MRYVDPFGLRWQFSQSTGQWSYVNDQTGASNPVGQGYSGTGEGRNNPDMQNIPNIGPIPQGSYNIGPGHDSNSTGPNTMNLIPQPDTNTFGRDLFRIHGNNQTYVGGNPISRIDPLGLAWQVTLGFGGGIIVPGFGFTAYTNWGINFDWLNTSGYIQDQVNYGLGAGYYAGWGLGIGGGHGDPVTTDVGTTPGYVEGDAGGGPYSGGASATLNNCGTPTAISGAVGAKVGAAAGAGAFAGSSWSSSISSPTIQDFINFIGSWF